MSTVDARRAAACTASRSGRASRHAADRGEPTGFASAAPGDSSEATIGRCGELPRVAHRARNLGDDEAVVMTVSTSARREVVGA
jgi:hypothetical protein